jgi:nucleotide-binding universal stress UspA family protein
MGTWRKVLCAIDFDSTTLPASLGDAAEVVLRAADREARLHGAGLVVVHALPTMYPGSPMSPPALEETLVQRERVSALVIDGVAGAVKQLTGRGPDEVAIHVDDGPADRAIVESADRLGADLIVVGSTGAKGLRRLLLGSVATAVVRHSHGSVLVARRAPDSGVVLLAVDFSPASDPAAELAAEEARRRGARLVLVHSVEMLSPELAFAEPGALPPTALVAIPPDEMIEAARQRLTDLLAALSVEGDAEVVAGHPAEGIVRLAAERRAELVVVGTSGRTGLDRLLLGSVATTVVRDASCPVLVARPRKGHGVRAPAPDRAEQVPDAAQA